MDENLILLEESLYLANPPQTTFPEKQTEQTEREKHQKGKGKNKKKPAQIVAEKRELRGANYRVYRMDDGTEQMWIYPEPIHVRDSQTQEFVDVENTLTEDAGDKHYRTRKGRYTARFSCDENTDELFSVEEGEHRLTVCMKGDKQHVQGGVVPKHRRNRLKDADKEKLCDTLTYSDICKGTDLVYSVSEKGVKEDIVIKHKAAEYRYEFELSCGDLIPELKAEGKQVCFLAPETGKPVFVIPAPFMRDADGYLSTDVTYELVTKQDGDVTLVVIADANWINKAGRAFPITVDPMVQVSGSSEMRSYSWKNGELTENWYHTVGITYDGHDECSVNRMYMSAFIPAIPILARVKKAELVLKQCCNVNAVFSDLALHFLTNGLYGDMAYDPEPIDCDRIPNSASVEYSFDITNSLDLTRSRTGFEMGFVLKMMDESFGTERYIHLEGVDPWYDHPVLRVTYETNYAVNSEYRSHTYDLGRFGQGSVDLQYGNVRFDVEDFAWGGNRMPINIRHQYNSALIDVQYTANQYDLKHIADFSAMKLGPTWKLNLMQSMIAASFVHEKVGSTDGYIFTDENGVEMYFAKSNTVLTDQEQDVSCNLFKCVDDEKTVYNPERRELTMGDEVRTFDEKGRLIKIAVGKNCQQIVYNENDRIGSVVDGAGRVFIFEYDADGYLTTITAPDNTKMRYEYNELGYLTAFVYPDDRKTVVTHGGVRLESVENLDANGVGVQKVEYSFNDYMLETMQEYGAVNGAYVTGVRNDYSYTAGSGVTTVMTTEPAEDGNAATTFKTVFAFDDNGEVKGKYLYSADTGIVPVEGEENGFHMYEEEGGADLVTRSVNLLNGHAFESWDDWTFTDPSCEDLVAKVETSEYNTPYGSNYLRMKTYASTPLGTGIYQPSLTLPAGVYTFSAYVRLLTSFEQNDNVANQGVYLRILSGLDTTGTILSESEHLEAYDDEYIRISTTCELTTAQNITVAILMDGAGEVRVNAPQLENNAYASPYNLLESGNFEPGSTRLSWSSGTISDVSFDMEHSLCLSGNLGTSVSSQQVSVKTAAGTRETFTLSGWAKSISALPIRERNDMEEPKFCLRASIKYVGVDELEETDFARFDPSVEGWQYASVQFAKQEFREVEYVTVFCDYSHNVGAAYFDNVQLTRDTLERSLTAEDFAGDADAAGSENAEDQEIESTDSAAEFAELLDAFGNTLTETTFTDGEFGTIYRSFNYSENGNDLVTETDARGEVTVYTVDTATSRNEAVIDRCEDKTGYVYDSAGRTTKVTSFEKAKDGNGNILRNENDEIVYNEVANVEYAYEAFDNLSEIVRGDGMKYVLAYDAFRNLKSIGINGKTEKLVSYTYKTGSSRLKSMSYANGHTMTATYNGTGQLIAEKWFDQANSLTAYYKYAYDADGNIVRSIDMCAKIEYTYTYEEGRLVRAAELAITVDEATGMVTGRTLVNTVRYTYDQDGNVAKKRIVAADGAQRTLYYEHPDNSEAIVKFTAGNRNVLSHSKTDSFGRKVFDELQLGSGFVSRQFHYHAGEITDEHRENDKLKSSATTQLVSQIVLSDGVTFSYAYDAEERITSVTETYRTEGITVTNTTTYTYDAQGQLLTESVNGTVVNRMTYDNYGNITSKNGVVYAYGDENWKDLLTAYNGQTITYDAQGNPLSYLGHTLTWEKGRQLKSFDGNTYTYNANGIRTSKTVGGIRHEYMLDGATILRETWDGNTLIPLYDNEDSVCGIEYNGTAYYFLKNLQGDIIAITDHNGDTVARYAYDAWGKCTVTQDVTACGIATINPFRYRGYYYDVDSGFYYLQSRYYDPETGRFLNGDVPQFSMINELVLSHNLFSYCYNSPIVNSDTIGYIAHNVVGAVVGVFMSLGTYFLGILMGFDTFSWWSLLWAVVGGAASGAFGASVYKRAIQVIFNIIDSVAVNVISCLKKAKVTLAQVVQEVVIGVIVGLISGLVGGNGNGKLFKKASNQYVKKWLSRNRNLIIKGTKYYIKSFTKLLKQKVVKPVFMAFMAGMITNTVLRKKFERLLA